MEKFKWLAKGAIVTAGLLFGSMSVQANEGDNTIPTATKAKVNQTLSGVLNDDDDIDYYAITAPENGRITVSSPQAGSRKTISIKDAYDYTYTSFTTNSAYLGNEQRSLDIAKGQTVYVKVSTPSYEDGIPYKVKVSFKAGENYEKEWNNELRTATKINATSKTKGILSFDDDVDYYKISLSKPGNLNLSMDNAGTKKSIEVIDGNLNWYGSFQTNSDYLGKSAINIGLPKGTYFIKVKTPSYIDNIPYQLNLKYNAGSYYEKELNNTIRSANTVVLNKMYQAAFQHDNDYDYYKFKVSSKGTYKFTMNNSSIGKSLVLLNSKQETVTSFSTSTTATGYSSVKATLKKGTYYIKTYENGYYDNVDYQFKVSKVK